MIAPILAVFAHLAAVDTAPSPYPPDPVCNATTTIGMSECNTSLYTTWNRRLTNEYHGAMLRVTPPEKHKLVQAERAWSSYRDANCQMYAAHEGTIHVILASQCLVDMTHARALELHALGRPQ